eukprot:gene15506-20928_t
MSKQPNQIISRSNTRNSINSQLFGQNQSLIIIKDTIIALSTVEMRTAFNDLIMLSISPGKKLIIIADTDGTVLYLPHNIICEPQMEKSVIAFFGRGKVAFRGPQQSTENSLRKLDILLCGSFTFIIDQPVSLLSSLTVAANNGTISNERNIDFATPIKFGLAVQNVTDDELDQLFHNGQFSFMAGAGVSCALSKDAHTWKGFLDKYAQVAMSVLNLDQNWLENVTRITDLLEKASRIANELNVAFAPFNNDGNHQEAQLEIHRLVAQKIYNKLMLEEPNTYVIDGVDYNPAVVLHSFRKPIITTNYDTAIEQAIARSTELTGRSRVTASHVEYTRINSSSPNGAWGPGQLANPLELLVIHIHGRYFDIGSEHGFCLTSEEYSDERVLDHFLKFMINFSKAHSLVFVGSGSTFYDYHFHHLWNELKNHVTPPHYVLCSDHDFPVVQYNVAAIRRLYGTNIFAVKFYEVNEDPNINGVLRHTQLYQKLHNKRLQPVGGNNSGINEPPPVGNNSGINEPPPVGNNSGINEPPP